MLHKYDPPLQAEAHGRELAEQAAVRGLLNSYLREKGIQDPRNREAAAYLSENTGSVEVPAEIWQELSADRGRGEPFVQVLPLSKAWIAGTITYYSMTGQHEYGVPFYVSTVKDRDGAYKPAAAGPLMDAVLVEVSFGETEHSREKRLTEMRGQIENSIRRTVMYLEHALKREAEEAQEATGYILSEQSLLYGHPFHPTPKSSEGFSDEDLKLYAPELGAAFSLHYLAVSAELVREEWLGDYRPAAAEIIEAARRKLGDRAEEYRLLPLHPWQAEYISRQDAVRRLTGEGKLVQLGALGGKVYPTSSVRTVWDPDTGSFYKLPLHVRITNFIRENTPEQVRRTMDAALVLNQAQQQGPEPWYGLRILRETGYRTLDVPSADEPDRDALAAAFTVIYRQAEELIGEEQGKCFVVASLLELPPGNKEPLLFAAARRSNGGALPDWQQWLTAYLRLSMLPLLRLFAEKGISLEAHVQNSLLSLEQGLPVRYYARDLEGISVSREQAALHGWTPTVISDDSPVLYSQAEAWMRLQYYYFVNQLGALIHTIARYDEKKEAVYWQTVRYVLQEHREHSEREDALRSCIDDLLSKRSLPAKANLISRFQGRGETPDFVDIPNPIYYCGGDLKS